MTTVITPRGHFRADRPRAGATEFAAAAFVPTSRRDRARVGHHMSPARRYAVLDATVARANAGLVTTADYLTDVLGADDEFVRRFSSPFGKSVAKVYREEYGQEPPKNGLARRRTMLLSVFAYGEDELPVLAKGALNYKRTADLLLAA